MNDSGNRFASYDGLRGFSAVYIVLFHLIFSHPDFASFSILGRSLVLAGSQTVPIFFVLSGIFVTSSLRKLLETKTRSLLDFAIRRFFRIVPLWWILLIWMFIINQISSGVLLANAIFFFGDMKLNSKWLPVVHSWSLAVEVCFYIFVGIFARAVMSATKNSILVYWLLCCLLTAVCKWVGYTYFELDQFQISSAAFSHLSYFAAGIAIEKWHHEGGRLEDWFRPSQVMVVEAVAISLFLLNFIPKFYSLPLEILAPLIVVLTGCSTGVLGKIMQSLPLRTLGHASYGIYILQNLASFYAARWFGTGNLAFFVFSHTATAILFGIISYVAIERPAIAIGRKLQSANRTQKHQN